MIKKYNINPLSSFFIGDRITDIQAGAAAKIKNLLLLVNDKMLDVNENSSTEPVLNLFFPLRDLKEFFQVEEIVNEN
jgi:histidinol phosphatase-like enzyme